MNMFARRVEPAAPVLPNATPAVSEEVAGFIDKMARQREELAYYKSECSTLGNELSLANESIRRLEVELTELRREHFRLMRHDTTMLAGLDQIKLQIVALLEKSKESEYSPPGTGTRSGLPAEQSDKILAGIVETLKPQERADG